jgi:CubicO group peptidase (beta-lactamase class C family)
MKKQLLFLLIILLEANFLFSQKITTVATPEAAGFSLERLQTIDKRMDEWVKKEWLNGGVILAVHDGKIAYYKSFGYNDMDTKASLQKDAIFRIASQTKAITTTAIMILFEEGKLSLDDPVSKYIPAFKQQTVLDQFNAADTTYTTVPAKEEVTIRHLLTHTSGIGYAQIGSKEANAIYAKSKITSGIGVYDDNLLAAMNRLAKLPLMHQPGVKWTYGLNSDLLGCLVEVISGTSLSDFFKKRIFEPLGMNDTYFNIPAEKASRLVTMYHENSQGHMEKETDKVLGHAALPQYPLQPTTYYSGGAGLSSTIYDYAVFLQMLLNDGKYNGKRILSRNSIRLMTTNQIGDIPFGGNDRFGLGFQLVTDKSSGRTMAQPGTFSWGGAFSTSYWVDPKEKLVLLFYRQLSGSTHGDVVEKVRTMVYQAMNE